MNKQTIAIDKLEINFTPEELALEKTIQELFDECLDFISITSFDD